MKPCNICSNARVDPELTEDNDLHYHTIGESGKGYRLITSCGNGRPLQILSEIWIKDHWILIGYYTPAFCPNCGRPITEYSKKGQEGEHHGQTETG